MGESNAGRIAADSETAQSVKRTALMPAKGAKRAMFAIDNALYSTVNGGLATLI
jgi:hypothetical protein